MVERISTTVGQVFDASVGFMHSADVGFGKPATEFCFRSDYYDQEITLLYFEGLGPRGQAEDVIEDVFDVVASSV